MSDNSAHIKTIVDIKKRRLNALLQQQAVYGIDSPAHIIIEIEDLRQEIVQMEGRDDPRTPTVILHIPEQDSDERAGGRCSEEACVFISYSHSDTRWLKRLQIHLKPLEQQGQIVIWDDTHIDVGQKWLDEIKRVLGTAKAAVLLISADFLASDFITNNEVPLLLAAAESRGAIIVPVIISPCRFRHIKSLAQFQAVNSPDQPVSMMSKGRQEAVFVKVGEAIEKALKL